MLPKIKSSVQYARILKQNNSTPQMPKKQLQWDMM